MAKESPQEGKATSISSPKPQVCCGALFLGSSSRGIWDSLLYLILTRRADAQPHAQQMERIRAPFALSPAQPHVCDAGCFREAGPCACPAQEPLYRDFTQRMKKCIDSLDFLGLQNHWGWWLLPWNLKTRAPWQSYDKQRQQIKKQSHYFAMVFPVVMYGCESWTLKKVSTEELMLLNCGVGEDF